MLLVALACAGPVQPALAAGPPQVSDGPQLIAPALPPGVFPANASVVGSTLQGYDGTWDSGSVIVRTWLRCDVISTGPCVALDQHDPTYTLVPDDAGHRIVFSVTATNDDGSTTAEASLAYVMMAPGLLSPPSIDVEIPIGNGETGLSSMFPDVAAPYGVGALLIAQPGSWAGFPLTQPLTYWYRCDALVSACVPLSPYPSTSHVIGLADVGSVLEIRLVASNDLGSVSAQAVSGVVSALPVSTLLDSYTATTGLPPLPVQPTVRVPPPAAGPAQRVVGPAIAVAIQQLFRGRIRNTAIFGRP